MRSVDVNDSASAGLTSPVLLSVSIKASYTAYMRGGSPPRPDEPVTVTGSMPRVSEVINTVNLPPGTGCSEVVGAAPVADGPLSVGAPASSVPESPQPAASSATANTTEMTMRNRFMELSPKFLDVNWNYV